ncbi:MAG: hypothetical protein AB7F36_16810 [Reyranellaceae bacterium]
MIRNALAAAVLLVAAQPALAQTASSGFETAAYVTCREAQALQPDQRRSLAVYLAEHSARYRGVLLPDGERGTQLALLVRGGCTLAPDAYLFTVIDRAIVAELAKLPRR